MDNEILIDCFYKFFVKKANYTPKEYINFLKGLDLLADELINQYQINDYIHETQKEDAIDMLIVELSNPDGKIMRRLRELFVTKVGCTEVIKKEQYNPLFFYLKKVLFTCLKECATDSCQDRIRFSKSVKDKLEILVSKGIVHVFNETKRTDLITYSVNPRAEKKGTKIVKQGLIIDFKREQRESRAVNYNLGKSIIAILCAEANRNYFWDVNDIVSSLYDPGKDVQFSSVKDDESDNFSCEEVILRDFHRNKDFEDELKFDEIDFKINFIELIPDNWAELYLEKKDSKKKKQMVREQFMAKLAWLIDEIPNRLKLFTMLPEHIALLGIDKVESNDGKTAEYRKNPYYLKNITEKVQDFLNVVLYNNYSNVEDKKDVRRSTSSTRHKEFFLEMLEIVRNKVSNEMYNYIIYSGHGRIVKDCVDTKVFPGLVKFYERIVKKGENNE